jgi:hypothetical protein
MVSCDWTFSKQPAAQEYETRHNLPSHHLQAFFEASIPNIRNTEVKSWGAALLHERGNKILDPSPIEDTTVSITSLP